MPNSLTPKVRALTPTTQASAIAYARELLARCEAGEVVSVTALEEMPGGLYQVHASETTDRLRSAGALLEAAIARLGYE